MNAKPCFGCAHHEDDVDCCIRVRTMASGRKMASMVQTSYERSPHASEGRMDGDACGPDGAHWRAKE